MPCITEKTLKWWQNFFLFADVHSLTPSLPHSPSVPGIFRQPWLVQLLTQAWEAHVVILIGAHFCTSATVWDSCVWLTDRVTVHTFLWSGVSTGHMPVKAWQCEIRVYGWLTVTVHTFLWSGVSTGHMPAKVHWCGNRNCAHVFLLVLFVEELD